MTTPARRRPATPAMPPGAGDRGPTATPGRRAPVLVAAVALMLAALGPAPVARAHSAAERQAEIDAELSRVRSQLAELTATEAAMVAEYQVATRELSRLRGEVAAIDADLARTALEVEAQRAALEVAVAFAREARDRLETTRTAVRAARLERSATARAAYMGAHLVVLDDLGSTLLDASEPAELLLAVRYASVAIAERTEAVAAARAAEAAEAVAARRVARAVDAAERARRDLVSRLGELARLRDSRAHALADIEAETARQAQLLERIRATGSAYRARIAELERASAEIAELLRREQTPGSGGPTGPLRWPLDSVRVTSGFGYRTHPILGGRRLHAGIDLAAATGTPVRAAAAGRVVHAGSRGGYGLTVVIDHGGSVATLYAHLSAIGVSVGEVVTSGQVIGRVGSTGLSTGPHLHFEVRRSGDPVDPRRYL